MKTGLNQPPATSVKDSLPDFFSKIKEKNEGLNVPDGYFDTLGPRIVDRINQQKNKVLVTIPIYRKPLVLIPLAVTVLLAVVLIINMPSPKIQPVSVVDELTEMNLVYDASYAEEALLAEAHNIDNELESINEEIGSVALSLESEPTDDEITEYLKEQEIDNEYLNQN
jgi:hypothetical protein